MITTKIWFQKLLTGMLFNIYLEWFLGSGMDRWIVSCGRKIDKDFMKFFLVFVGVSCDGERKSKILSDFLC